MIDLANTPFNAPRNLRREERRARRIAGMSICGGIAVIAFLIALAATHIVATVLLAVPICMALGVSAGGSFYVLEAIRMREARSGLGLKCRRVLCVGVGSGRNIAVFPSGVQPEESEPDFMLRRRVVRKFSSAEALCTATEDPPRGSLVSLFDEVGAVLAVGRVVDREEALTIWALRNQEAPFFPPNP